ncbi:winged helix-turn-helix domain-containing protein [Serratia silvae]
MATRYLINKEVLFIPGQRRLAAINSTHSVTLFAPVCNCLRILIENRDCVVPQDELLQRVWGNKRHELSANTLYQNLSLLRKSLKLAGLNGKVVKTIPRRGVILERDVVIDSYNGDDTDEEIAITASHSLSGKGRNLHLLWLLLILIMVGIYVNLFVDYTFKHPSGDFFTNYTVLVTKSGCDYYAMPADKERRKDRLDNAIEKLDITCSSPTHVYITLSENDPYKKEGLI